MKTIPKKYFEMKEYYKLKEYQKAACSFKWKSSDIDIPENIELIIQTNGSIGYSPKLKKWLKGEFTGLKDDLNRFTTYTCFTLATEPKTYNLENNTDIFVCGNNRLYESDEPLFDWYAGFSEDIDKSMYFQLINSRNIPSLIADSDAKARQIREAFKQIEAGVPVVITTDIFDNTEVLNLTDSSLIDKIQYITSFYNEMDKRFANLRGIDVNTLDKRAQVTSDELDQFSDVTSGNYLAMYEARLDFVEKMKEAGINIECIPNPIYKDEPKEEEIDSIEAQEEAASEEEIEEKGGNRRK